jgi:hypothetical protein
MVTKPVVRRDPLLELLDPESRLSGLVPHFAELVQFVFWFHGETSFRVVRETIQTQAPLGWHILTGRGLLRGSTLFASLEGVPPACTLPGSPTVVALAGISVVVGTVNLGRVRRDPLFELLDLEARLAGLCFAAGLEWLLGFWFA